jgi:type VI secretion system secreted protein Hcp
MPFQTIKKWTFSLAFVTVILAAGVAQAETIYVSVAGQIQGPFKGEFVQKNLESKFLAHRFRYSAGIPRDPLTGMATGRLQHKPVIITKGWGASSAQFFQAMLTNENLAQVVIDFVAPDASGNGVMVLTHRIRLTNARVVDISQSTDSYDPAPKSLTTMVQLEDISLTFQRIDIEDVLNKTTVTSDSARP